MRAFPIGLMALLLISAAEPVTEPAAKPAPVLIAKPALWKVSDADTTIYLFGTIHLLKPGTQWFEGKIKTAFDASDELVLEMIQPSEAEAQKIVISRAIDPDGPPLSQKLTPKDAAKFRAALKTLDIDPEGLEPFEPWFASTLVAMAPMQKLGYDPETGAEKVLTAEAKAEARARMEQGRVRELVHEVERERFNEAALVARRNPELEDYLKRSAGEKANGETLPPTDPVLQRAVDAVQSRETLDAAKLMWKTDETGPESLQEEILKAPKAVPVSGVR